MVRSMYFFNPQFFWEWFERRQEKYKYPSRLSAKEAQHWAKRLPWQMERYTLERFFTDISCDELNNRARMVISVHGNIKRFEKLALFGEAAPVIEGWEFVTFYPPGEACVRHNYPSVTTKPDECWFSPSQLVLENNRYNLDLYVDGSVNISWETKGAATQMMFNVLGERIGGLYIRQVSVNYLSTVLPELRQDLQPMTKLPEYIRSDGSSGMRINGQGIIKPGGK